VEGSVSRSGDKVRITAQLIDARADKHLWAKSFERSSRDVLALQAELASAIARRGQRAADSERAITVDRPRSVNPEAHDAYLKGRYFFNRPSDDNLQKAIAQFEEAVRLSPDVCAGVLRTVGRLPLGWVQRRLSHRHRSEGPRPRRSREGVELDDSSAEAHTSLAVFKLFYEYDLAGCEREFRRASRSTQLRVRARSVRHGAGFQGRFDEAIAEGSARSNWIRCLPRS
jgi:hypothetical protein